MIERNLYPSQLAKITGIRRQKIYTYLQGTSEPRAFTVKTIAEKLGVSADYLLGVKLKESPKQDKKCNKLKSRESSDN